VQLRELDNLIRRGGIPSEGLITGFIAPEDLSELWERLESERVLAAFSGGSEVPRRVMLRLVPPESGAAHLGDVWVRSMLDGWQEHAASFPLEWLHVRQSGLDEYGGHRELEQPQADKLAAMLYRHGLPPTALGEVARSGKRVLILVDSREHAQAVSAVCAAGLSVAGKVDFAPDECLRAKNLSLGSPRLDAAVSRACNLGRAEAKTAVERGFVAVNLKLCRDAAHTVASGDLVHHLLEGAVRIREAKEGRRAGRHTLDAVAFGWTGRLGPNL
jgi:RNA-binding protein YlmH